MIKICECHTGYHVPLIQTLAFRGAEYWCPYCGFTGGIFGSGMAITTNKILQERLKKYKEISENYLTARGREYAVATTHDGKIYRPPSALPDKVKALDEEYKKNWKYNQEVN